MNVSRRFARFLALGFTLGILVVAAPFSVIPAPFSVIPAPFSVIPAKAGIQRTISQLFARPANAVAGTATFSGTDETLTGDITAGRLVDQANSSYYIDPAASGNSLITAGAASVSGNLVLNAGATIGTTNMQPLILGSSTTGATTVTSGGKLQLQAGGTGTGSTGTGSIYFLNSSGNTRGRFDASTSIDATGGTITYSGGYTIHTFTTSGTFTPGNAGNVEYLVVAGGGGGGSGNYAGGGGAGGLLTGTGFAVTAQGYAITVGGGGASATSGSNSVFSTVTATGGGKGGSASNGVPDTGGSGGGGSPTTSGAAGTGGQGYAGGNGNQTTTYAGGGGGGSGGVGANAGVNIGGNGGIGTASSISGSSVTYASGGGGGAYGGTAGTASAGGGGNGNSTGAGYNATANTGGGGGGAGTTGSAADGGAGGSGIVIIRYPTYGTLYLGSTNTSAADLAEYYVSGDKTIEAGDVVTISNIKYQIANSEGETEELVSKGVLRKADKPYDPKLIGIISTSPGVLMGSIDGENKEDKRMLALAGKVPVKIDPDSPAIEVGDFLTSSTKPGLATKATHPGYIVARALESWTSCAHLASSSGAHQGCGAPTIEAFISLTYYMGDIDAFGNFRTLEVDTLKVNNTLKVGGVNILDRLNKQQDEINELRDRIQRLESR